MGYYIFVPHLEYYLEVFFLKKLFTLLDSYCDMCHSLHSIRASYSRSVRFFDFIVSAFLIFVTVLATLAFIGLIASPDLLV